MSAAANYKTRGLVPIPIDKGKKGPEGPEAKGWNVRTEYKDSDFSPDGNIGLLTGPLGKDLLDVDLDCDEAVAMAPWILPPTDMIQGRPSRPRSHYYFRGKTETLDLVDPGLPANEATIVELRAGTKEGKAFQTLAPPSLHPAGERVKWEKFGEPAEVDGDALARAVKRLAASVLVQRSFIEGNTHFTLGAWAGYLLGNGMEEDDAENFLVTIAETFGHDVSNTRYWVKHSAEKVRADEPATGGPTLENKYGVPHKTVTRVMEWLGVALFRKSRAVEIAGNGGLRFRSDVWNARRMVERHREDIRFCTETGRWLVWDGRRWRDQEQNLEITAKAKETILSLYQEAAGLPERDRQEMIRHALACENRQKLDAMVYVARDEITIRSDALDRDNWLLACPNGTLDLRTGRLIPEHRREDFITKAFPVEFDSWADEPKTWLAFLDRIMRGRRTLIEFLRRALGYSLTGDVREHKFFILYGQGANGKGTFINASEDLFGPDHFRVLPFEDLQKHRHEQIPTNIAALRGARFVKSAEGEEDRPLAEARLKLLTGGESIKTRRLHENGFEFMPQFKLWVATNHLPRISGTDEAIWRRVVLIPFEEFIPEKERDGDLRDKIRAELPGILRWAVRGCHEWQEAQGLLEPEEVKAATSEYRKKEDVLQSFIDDTCVLESAARVSPSSLHQSYLNWCDRNDEQEPLSIRAFAGRIVGRNLQQKSGSRGREWHGIRLRTADDGPRY